MKKTSLCEVFLCIYFTSYNLYYEYNLLNQRVLKIAIQF